MRLLSLNKFFYFFIFFSIIILPLKGEEETLDIWKKDENNNKQQDIPVEENSNNINILKQGSSVEKIEIVEGKDNIEETKPIYGLFDPEENNLNLGMWSKSNGKQIKDIFKRISKIQLSNTAEDFFLSTILTYSYPPSSNISEKEFLDLKIQWLIKNDKEKILEEFLNKNTMYEDKKKIIHYLVDKNIAEANLSLGCKRSEFISKEIKDPYLEKFRIYCLIFNNKKNEAQLLFDILREQGHSDKFFDDKINFLLGIKDEPTKKIKDDNLLNFYISSITVPDFKYEANEKTDKFIWEYLNSANLVTIENIEDKEKIRNLELAAQNDNFDKVKIFEIYKRFQFDLNTLINAEGTYQSLDEIESRALLYQKFLLSDNIENKIKILFLLKNLFKKDDLSNIFTEFMSDRLKEFDKKDVPDSYTEIVEKNIISEEEYKLGRIKFDDKILHRSKVLKYYTGGNTSIKKTQKDLNNVFKKIRGNKKYFFSAKDLALVESLQVDGFEIPKTLKYNEIAKKYSIPEGLINLTKNQEIGLLILKFVEIIGEDELSDLDPETIYFITHILNKSNLIKFRNKVLVAALPVRS